MEALYQFGFLFLDNSSLYQIDKTNKQNSIISMFKCECQSPATLGLKMQTWGLA